MNLNNTDFIIASEERFNNSETSAVIGKLPKQGNPNAFDLETEKRVNERLEHLEKNAKEPIEKAEERIMGTNDLMSINYLQLGFLCSFPVCRIHVININGGNEGLGTGFMISPSLLITNHHVIEEADFAVNSIAEFNYQFNEFGKRATPHSFEFKPDVFFRTSKELDYTVIAVSPVSTENNKKLSDFGYLKLYEEPGKALLTEHLSIIQHPGGGFKQIALRENRLINVDDNFVTYSTDTTQGSSGSCVLNDQWQVIALHHSGVPRKDAEGHWLKKDGSIWQEGEDDSLIDWLSNEGVRISSIISDLRSAKGEDVLFKELLTAPPVMPKMTSNENFVTKENKSAAKETPSDETAGKITEQPITKNSEATKNMNNTDNQQNSITVTIPIEVTVKVGNAVAGGAGNAAPDKKVSDNESAFETSTSVNPNYTTRNGYSSSFIKTANFRIDLLDLVSEQIPKLAPLLNPTTDNKYILKYFNFSVILNKFRKLCVLTAVNIDGSRSQDLGRENNPWILDPRVDVKYQTGPAVYKNNDLDRGHMVRRLDPVWGDNAEAANNDTFHLTNSTPQHKNLNQKTWLSLEEYILGNTENEKIRASVFTGPIFGENDIPYRGVLLPLQFYKVAAMIKKDGKPSVSGYMLSQPDEIQDFKDLEGIKDTGFGEFKTYQVPLAKIAKLTGLKFDKFIQYDPLGNVNPDEKTSDIEINGSNDIKL